MRLTQNRPCLQTVTSVGEWIIKYNKGLIEQNSMECDSEQVEKQIEYNGIEYNIIVQNRFGENIIQHTLS